MELASVTALVTGGASGLGRATAQHLVEGGAKVVLADLDSSAGAKAARGLGERAVFAHTDVTQEDSVEAALEASLALGELNVVINCAGIAAATRVVGKRGVHPLDRFKKVLEVNLVGTFNVIRLAAARMAAASITSEERGVIVNTASVAAFEGQIGQAAYAASKSGVAGMTLPLARDLAEHRIRVVTIAPGIFHTPMFDTLSPEAIKSLGAQTPHPARVGNPYEYAALATHIIENPMLNGETIRLDGAIRMAPR